MKIGLKTKILTLSVFPMILLGITVILLTLTTIKGALVDEIQEALRGTATATLAAYNQNPGDYRQTAGGEVYKGYYSISESESLVDNIKESSGMDITFFYGTDRIMTSALDQSGERIVGSPAGDTIAQNVLENGEEYFSQSVSIDGRICYGYYIPVYQNNSTTEIVGMICALTDKNENDAMINKILTQMVAAVIIMIILGFTFSLLLTISITKSLNRGIDLVQEVASGDLNNPIDSKLLKRRDEIGKLSQSISQLQSELRLIIEKITTSSEQLTTNAGTLKSTSMETNEIIKQVETAVNSITQNASEQAQGTKVTSDNVYQMGDRIEETSKEVKSLNKNADAMRHSSEQATVTIKELKSINEEVEQSIATVFKQTNQANESARKIREATEIIANIAEETNLLSLNASIEAARAGESGRGFAVVAGQIQTLAEQSNKSSKTIEGITDNLINDSDVTVEAMQHVMEIIGNQSRKMTATEQIMSEVIDRINTSLKGIEQIDDTTKKLDNTRNTIVGTVESLSHIAEYNATNTHDTLTQTAQMANAFISIEESAGNLKDISDELSNTMKHFRL